LKSPAMAALLLFALWTAPMPTSAHKASDSYLTLTRVGSDAGAISGRWDIALRDLDNAITLDTNGDGDISWGEVRAKQRAFDIRLLQHELPIPDRKRGAHLVELEDFARHIPASADCRPALVGAADDLTYDRVTEHLEVLNPQRSRFFCRPRAIEINFETQPSALHVGIETDELQHLPRIA